MKVLNQIIHTNCHNIRRNRAFLHNCFLSLFIYFQAKSSIVDANREVYTITDESLPSHMRSLLPSHEQQVHDLLTLERTRRRLRYVIITLTIMLALTVLVAVTLVFSLRVKPVTGMVEGTHYRKSSSPSRDEEVGTIFSFLWFSFAWFRNDQCMTRCLLSAKTT